jgi:hypothetical protein
MTISLKVIEIKITKKGISIKIGIDIPLIGKSGN